MARRTLFAAVALLLGAVPVHAPVAAGGQAFQSRALVIDSAPASADPLWVGGLWHVSPAGDIEKVLRRRWLPLAPNRDGVVAAVPNDARERDRYRYWIVRPEVGSRRLPHATSAPPCASWSGDDGLVSYLSGAGEASGTRGVLWVAPMDAPDEAKPVATGLFPECPTWSPEGRRLAYFVRTKRNTELWDLYVYDGAGSERVSRTTGPAQSGATKNRSFDWSPDGDTLAWIHQRSIQVYDQTGTRRLTEKGALTPVIRRIEGNSKVQALRFSLDGELLGVGIGYGAGIFDADGDAIAYVRGIVRGWAGNVGLLTARPYRGAPSLLLHRAVPDSSPELIQKYSKQPVITSPDGDWFAYLHPHQRDELVFRAPGGRLINQVDLDLRAGTPGAIGADGRFKAPPWP
ncbi:MAG: hypothetical protein M3285_14060 [Actinomycetota bacterium]|nr:hypothetical protein [Actinomycetota bacterium]